MVKAKRRLTLLLSCSKENINIQRLSKQVRNSPLTHLEHDDEHVELLAPRGPAGCHIEGDVLQGARLVVEGRVQVEGHTVRDGHQEGERPAKGDNSKCYGKKGERLRLGTIEAKSS